MAADAGGCWRMLLGGRGELSRWLLMLEDAGGCWRMLLGGRGELSRWRRKGDAAVEMEGGREELPR